MQIMLVVSLVVALAQSVAAQNASKLDAPVGGEFRIDNPLGRSPCSFWTAVDQLARRAHVVVGFENTRDCGPGAWSLHPGEGALDLTGMTARQALDQLVALNSTYRWQESDGVVVIRPIAAWDDPTNMLNRPMASFNVTNAQFLEFVEAGGYGIRDLWSPEAWEWLQSRKEDHPLFWSRNGGSGSVTLRGGTMKQSRRLSKSDTH